MFNNKTSTNDLSQCLVFIHMPTWQAHLVLSGSLSDVFIVELQCSLRCISLSSSTSKKVIFCLINAREEEHLFLFLLRFNTVITKLLLSLIVHISPRL